MNEQCNSCALTQFCNEQIAHRVELEEKVSGYLADADSRELRLKTIEAVLEDEVSAYGISKEEIDTDEHFKLYRLALQNISDELTTESIELHELRLSMQKSYKFQTGLLDDVREGCTKSGRAVGRMLGKFGVNNCGSFCEPALVLRKERYKENQPKTSGTL